MQPFVTENLSNIGEHNFEVRHNILSTIGQINFKISMFEQSNRTIRCSAQQDLKSHQLEIPAFDKPLQ